MRKHFFFAFNEYVPPSAPAQVELTALLSEQLARSINQEIVNTLMALGNKEQSDGKNIESL